MKSIINNFIKATLSKLGYSLLKNKKSAKVLPNVFNTSHKKVALLSYIKSVFENSENKNYTKHTNHYTTYLIAETLNALGYNVDVIDCGDDLKDDFEKYNLVIGLGK